LSSDCGWSGHFENASGQAGETLTGIEPGQVFVVRRVVNDFTAGRLAVT
jgi:hypothetical protein